MREMSAQPRKIVVAFDGSEPSIRALDAAAQLVGYGSTLTVVTIAPSANGAVREALADARTRLLDKHVAARYIARSGEPAVEIVEAARELEADLIVVGRRTPPADESVSAQVVATAASDVLVVA
jgi:nucleotide-binding universal stress UspA family protein